MDEKHPPPQYPSDPTTNQNGATPTITNVVPPQTQGQSAAITGQQYRDQLFALCAQGLHERKTEHGVCGIITAIALFPFGLICLFMDTRVICSRCGVTLQK